MFRYQCLIILPMEALNNTNISVGGISLLEYISMMMISFREIHYRDIKMHSSLICFNIFLAIFLGIVCKLMR